MIQADLDELIIPEKELEDLSGIALSDGFSGNFYHPDTLRDGKKLFAFLLHELLIFCVTLVVSLPIALLANRNQVGFSDAEIFVRVLQITLGLSLAITVVWNVYKWVKAKPLATLAGLLDEVEKYHEVIKALDIIDRLTAAGNLQANLINRQDAIEALKITRESLVCALKTERILRENQKFIGRRYELFANIESNLAALMALDVSDRASEYGRLLNEALEIGMSVHKEVRKLQNGK
ncbi:MAG: hypothetical protein JGK24_15555 [Microcoleus sp. PH2017_29_MFU_D_A]|uniref:hypothetical protein n=1 Tax=unclassified Microcoleus TaxID=2642155 RepID=UPI001D8F749D|nr:MULTISPECIES: hypothetical protein [unclassified Microcoleus]MCC3454713.1 hypothetical protein [Microcoleus sp. PH2017_08_TRC_O_A]MCC3569239.1 hypothetical protein [Microcoleus sp. PH2017_31_RDM_U_A]MCC3581546.1 hypothetical protein [Microcoleus sp. PH2017_32_RDM_D_A]MCC3584884.1 hypothetical protein [Microcoleus sp. PH2017_30_WIL_O_A]MCC3604591.1 hypothetical protein [Microcoleus sp. PH2017_29_MFU_D_A]